MASFAGRLKLAPTRSNPWALGLALFALGALLVWLLSQWVDALAVFPESWRIELREPLNEAKRWVVLNRSSHWLFVYFFTPLSGGIDFFLRRVEDFLLWLPWPVVVAAFFFLAERIRGLRLGLLTLACLLPLGLFGLWAESLQTLALMTTAVLFSLSIGIPLGIWSAHDNRVERVLRPILDTMQTMPAFVYLIPVLLFFGVARVPSIIATIIYALPPAIRLTNLGLRSVSEDVVEAAQSFGSTDRQLLRKVKLPMALPTIMVGVNQTIMMALSMVVIAALIGAGGLGNVVLRSLRRLQVGAALEAGLAIVLLAILLDRLTAGLAMMERQSKRTFSGFRLFGEKWGGYRLVLGIERAIDWVYRLGWLTAVSLNQLLRRLPGGRWVGETAVWPAILLSLLLLTLLLRLAGVDSFPAALRLDIRQPVDALVQWMQVNLYNIGNSGIGTGPLRNFLILQVFQPLQRLMMDDLPWSLIVFAFAALGYVAGGWRLSLKTGTLMLLIGLIGMWPYAMDTLVQTIVAVTICVMVGIPLGMGAAHSDRLDRALRPLLDFLQTIPIFVYLVPVIMLFGSGNVAGLIASVLYAIVPVIRLTNAGIRGVDPILMESAASFGSTSWQKLRKVEIPLAFPAMMLGVNQTIMMSLAMVIIAGLVGATGLGAEVVQGFANDNLGRSLEAGLAIVLCAIVLDRITQGLAYKTDRDF
jgi:glycine betaine/proline transport system permease protein